MKTAYRGETPPDIHYERVPMKKSTKLGLVSSALFILSMVGFDASVLLWNAHPIVAVDCAVLASIAAIGSIVAFIGLTP